MRSEVVRFFGEAHALWSSFLITNEPAVREIVLCRLAEIQRALPEEGWKMLIGRLPGYREWSESSNPQMLNLLYNVDQN